MTRGRTAHPVGARRAFFDQAAGSWDVDQRPDPRRLAEILEELGVAAGEKVVDLGCGTGVLIPHLVAAVGPGGFIFAVDFSPLMLAPAKAKNLWTNVSYIEADAANLPLKSESASRVVCFSAFPHFPDKGAVMREAARVLVPGGFLQVAHLSSSRELADFHASTAGAVKHDRLPTARWMGRLASESGLVVRRLTDEPGRYLFSAVKG